MSLDQIVRAWKDEEYRLSLSAEERVLLPEHPAGLLELTDEALDDLMGGASAHPDSCCWNSCSPPPPPPPKDPI